MAKKLYMIEIYKEKEGVPFLVDKVLKVWDEESKQERENFEKEEAKRNGCYCFITTVEEINGYQIKIEK